MSAKNLTLQNNLDEVDRLREEVSGWIANSLDAIEKNRVILAIDEAFVNIVEHGYRGGEKSNIDVTMDNDSKQLTFVIMDRAPEFDPTVAPSVDAAEHAGSGKDGGLGIHLFRTIMQTTYAKRSGGGNCLTLVKKLK